MPERKDFEVFRDYLNSLPSSSPVPVSVTEAMVSCIVMWAGLSLQFHDFSGNVETREAFSTIKDTEENNYA